MPFLKWRSPPGLAWLFLSLLILPLAGCPGGSRNYGAACTGVADCTGGLGCVTAFSGGYCSALCTGDATCSGGGRCDLELAGGLCVASCSASSECRDGYQCWMGGCRPRCVLDTDCGGDAVCTAGQCVGRCETMGDCNLGETCSAGRCVPVTDAGMVEMPDGGIIADGSPCTASSECISGLCLPPERGGICSRTCSDASSCFASVTFSAACAPAAVDGVLRTACVPFDATGLANGSACSADSQCASRTCTLTPGSGGLCAEACDGVEDCLAGERCTALPWSTATFNGCGYPPRVGAVEILEIDLGEHAVSAGSGATLELGVPADAISATLRAEHVSGDVLPMSFYSVTSPSGASLYSLSEFFEYIDQPIRWYPADGEEAIAMLVPNTTTDRYAFEIGRYPFGVLAFGETGRVTMRLSLLVKRAAPTLSSGVLDLAIYPVGVGLTAANAGTNARVVAMLDRMENILSQIGVSLGSVTYYDVPSATATRLAIIESTDGPTSELAELFRLSAGHTSRVLPLFLVRSIEAGGDGFNTLGIAGGIPGSTAIYGTNNSGVVVAFDPGVVGPGVAGGTVAGHVCSHESSHFFGLFHVTESRRACGPGETPGDTCLPFGATDVIGDTTRGDRTNLMHWSIEGGGTNDILSAGQGFVILRSPLTR